MRNVVERAERDTFRRSSPVVLLVSEPGIDGVFRHVEGLSRYLVSRGCVPHLAYSSRRGSEGLRVLVEELQAAGARTVDLGVSNSPAPSDAVAMAKLIALARDVRPDVIHAHSSKAGALVRPLAPLFPRSRIFYTAHAYFGMGKSRSPKVRFFNGVEKALGGIGTTINISPDEARFARETLGVRAERQRIHHNPVNTEFFRPATPEERLAARRKLGLPVEGRILGTVGRFVPQKDPLTLYRAAAPCLNDTPDLHLFHIGWGALEQTVDELCAELGIAGKVRRGSYMEDTRVLYHALDALAVTSTYEAGWPIVILEAMACGLPVITTTAPGMSDIGSSGLSHCWTAPVGDIEGITSAVRQWLAAGDPPITTNHRQIACERFSPGKCFGGVWGEYTTAS